MFDDNVESCLAVDCYFLLLSFQRDCNALIFERKIYLETIMWFMVQVQVQRNISLLVAATNPCPYILHLQNDSVGHQPCDKNVLSETTMGGMKSFSCLSLSFNDEITLSSLTSKLHERIHSRAQHTNDASQQRRRTNGQSDRKKTQFAIAAVGAMVFESQMRYQICGHRGDAVMMGDGDQLKGQPMKSKMSTFISMIGFPIKCK